MRICPAPLPATAASVTFVASGPIWSGWTRTPPGRSGIRAYVGLRPTTPHKLAGWRMEPPVSEPSMPGPFGRRRRRPNRRRAAGDEIRVPGISGRAHAAFGGGAHREFVHIGLSDDHGAGRLKAVDYGVVRRAVFLKIFRSPGPARQVQILSFTAISACRGRPADRPRRLHRSRRAAGRSGVSSRNACRGRVTLRERQCFLATCSLSAARLRPRLRSVTPNSLVSLIHGVLRTHPRSLIRNRAGRKGRQGRDGQTPGVQAMLQGPIWVDFCAACPINSNRCMCRRWAAIFRTHGTNFAKHADMTRA